MFLTKKKALTSKDKPKPQKALGGWEDEEQQQNPHQINKLTPTNPHQSIDILEDPINIPNYNQQFSNQLSTFSQPVLQNRSHNPKPAQKPEQMYYTYEQLQQMPAIECEKKLVEQIVEPGGIRLKPNQTILNDFYNECKSLNMAIIGSLLLSKLEVMCDFQVKAKSLYVIEFLAKKSQQYNVYFKLQHENIRQALQPETNVENFQKIRKLVLSKIGAMRGKEQQLGDAEKMTYEDKAGYSKDKKGVIADLLSDSNPDNPKDHQQQLSKSGLRKKLISPQEAKKQMIGPNKTAIRTTPSSNNSNNNFDLLNELPSQIPKNTAKQTDLLTDAVGQTDLLDNESPPQNHLTFQQLLSNTGQNHKKADALDFTF